MNDYDAFLSACQKSPKDIGLRLVFADWLEEHDEILKAEFLRLEASVITEPHNSTTRIEQVVALITKYDELIKYARGKINTHQRRVSSNELKTWIAGASLQCQVVLNSYYAKYKLLVDKWIQEMTGMGLQEAKRTSERLPAVIKSFLPTIDALFSERALACYQLKSSEHYDVEVKLID